MNFLVRYIWRLLWLTIYILYILLYVYYIQCTSKVSARENLMFLSLNYTIVAMIINYICIGYKWHMLSSKFLRIKIN